MKRAQKHSSGFVMALLALHCLTVAPAWSDPPQAQAQTQTMPAFDTWDTARLLSYGRNLLKKGKNYALAVAALTVVTQRTPDDRDAQLDLASACAGRFASLAEAEQMQKAYPVAKEIYANQQKTWQKAQADTNYLLYNMPPPVPLSEPFTPDDGQKFLLTPTAVQAEKKILGLQALTAMGVVQKAEATLQPKDKAKSEYSRGWILVLLSRDGKDVLAETDPSDQLKNRSNVKSIFLIPHKDIINCFRQATEAMPKEASYWQSLALSYVPELLDSSVNDGYHKYLTNTPISSRENVELATTAMTKALAIRPNDFNAQYQQALILLQAKPHDSLVSLTKAATLEGNNAFLWYMVASQTLEQSPAATPISGSQMQFSAQIADAVAAIQRGNAVSEYAKQVILPPLPTVLRTPWLYRPAYGFAEDGLVLQTVGYDLREALRKQLDRGDQTLVLPSAEALVEMGTNAINHFRGDDIGWSDPRDRERHYDRLTMGGLSIDMAKGIIKDAQAKYPNEAKANYLNPSCVCV